jgi:uncharacterized SAM-binding protein YcdF (DUF218 family)
MSDSPALTSSKNLVEKASLVERPPLRLTRRTIPVWIVTLGLTLLCVIAVATFSRQIRWGLGAMLVNAGPPQPADIAVTLAGDASGNRVLKAAELVRQGYVPRVLVSGAERQYGIPESTLAINFAVAHGYPRDYFIALQHPSLSTTEESGYIIPQLRKLGVRKYLLVTSPYHTARAGRILHRAAPDLEMHIVAAMRPHWNNGYWWTDREGQKIWLQEEAKTIAELFGI